MTTDEEPTGAEYGEAHADTSTNEEQEKEDEEYKDHPGSTFGAGGNARPNSTEEDSKPAAKPVPPTSPLREEFGNMDLDDDEEFQEEENAIIIDPSKCDLKFYLGWCNPPAFKKDGEEYLLGRILIPCHYTDKHTQAFIGEDGLDMELRFTVPTIALGTYFTFGTDDLEEENFLANWLLEEQNQERRAHGDSLTRSIYFDFPYPVKREFADDVIAENFQGFGNSFVQMGDRVNADGTIKESTKYARTLTFTLQKANVIFNAATKSSKSSKILKSPKKEKRSHPGSGQDTGSPPKSAKKGVGEPMQTDN